MGPQDSKTNGPPGEIRIDCVYTLREFLARTGMGRAAWDSLRRKGLPALKAGKLIFVHGGDFVDFLKSRKAEPRDS